ncbi:MAG: galactose-1-phosphate uridylyltransferase [Candidatus Moranbacteria bacterium]|nr:galactose-1-phosphate uridylyltransferase [Candidatus Moranbacteria bacterium]
MKIEINKSKKDSKKKTGGQKKPVASKKTGAKSELSSYKKKIDPKTDNKPVSELRQDPVTGDWVVIATKRAKRPEDFTKDKKEVESIDPKDCPFCEQGGISKQKPDTLIYYRQDDQWSLRVFPNLYPAFTRSKKVNHQEDGMYFSMDGVGYHEVIVTRDHDRGVPFLLKEEIAEVLDSFKTRYIELMNRKSVNYIMFIENHGKESGASLVHPHWQMFAIPVVSPGVKLELEGSQLYKRNRGACVFCQMIEREQKEKKRIIAQNDSFIAFAPFASRAAFEVWIMPKKHQPYFERIREEEEFEAAEILKTVIEKYYWNLKDVSYNMYLHTSPCDGRDYHYFHWHIELIPKTAVWAGFELGTGIEISTIEPERAAKHLRKNMDREL